MTQRNWYDSHSNTLDLDHEWTWPDMPTRALQQVQDDIDNTWQENNNPLINPAGVAISGMAGENESHDGIKTWDLNDPALTLSNFLESPAWINQSMLPGSDFVNLLRVLRPVDHAFFHYPVREPDPTGRHGRRRGRRTPGDYQDKQFAPITSKVHQRPSGMWAMDPRIR